MHPLLRTTAGLWAGALLLLALPATAQDYDHEEVIDRSFTVEPGQRLSLETDRGSVTVRGTDGNRVVVKVTKGADDMSEKDAEERFARFEVLFDETADGVEIEGRYDGGRRWRNKHIRVHFEIAVPRTFDVALKTSGGSVHAENLRGVATLRTAGGAITALDIDGPLTAHTAGGSVTAERIGGEATLHTSGGAITAAHIRGDVTAHTSGGSIRMEEIYGTVDAQTSGGSITAHLATAPNDELKLKTSGGSITLHLPENTAADLDAKSSGGRVRTDLPVTIEGEMKRNRLRGTLNGGGPLLTLRTSGGSVRILKN